MAINTEIQYEAVDELYLDPLNPRLGRRNVAEGLSQKKVLELMEGWSLEELAVSFLESGFWPQEALVVVNEKHGKSSHKVVVEGNRRLAALKLLWRAKKGEPVADRWREIARTGTAAAFKQLTNIPYVLADSRKDVIAYLGFRHVTGIKEWKPAEKAEYIASLIEAEKLDYEQVRRKIGSKIQTVRQNYISYRLLLQMEDKSEEISIENVEERFSVLYLSLRTEGVQSYLHIDIGANEKAARMPVPKSHLKNLANFALWLFGDKKHKPLIADSRDVDRFGVILQSAKALEYLKRTDNPTFEAAFRFAGGDEVETARYLERACDEVEEALRTVHHHKKSKRVAAAILRLGQDMERLLELFPAVSKALETGARS